MSITVGIDTYADMTFLDNYINLDFQARSSWNLLPIENRELYAKMAAKFIDKCEWIGRKTADNQVLQFPRYFGQYISDPSKQSNYMDYQYYNNSDDTGITTTIRGYQNNPYYANSDVIFEALKKAQAEIIIHFLVYEKDASLIKLVKMKDAGIQSFSVSSLSFNFKDDTNEDLPLPKEAYKLMKYYLLYNSSVIRLERG